MAIAWQRLVAIQRVLSLPMVAGQNRPVGIEVGGRPAHATLQRTVYRFEFSNDEQGGYQNLWSRQRWDVLDRVQSSRSQISLGILVERVSVRYLSHGRSGAIIAGNH